MGSSVISIGTRHVKVWRVEPGAPTSPSKARLELDASNAGPSGSPTPKTFSGRNCLLGDLIETTFTALVAVSDSEAIVCTAQGDICLLDDADRTQRLNKVGKVDFKVNCVTFDSSRSIVWVAGEGGRMKALPLGDLVGSDRSNMPPSVSFDIGSESVSSSGKQYAAQAVGIVRNRIILVDSNRSIEIKAAEDTNLAPDSNSVCKKLPAHESAVLGVRSLLPKSSPEEPDFLTFSARGTVRFWSLDGTCTHRVDIPLDQPNCAGDGEINELRTVVPLYGRSYLLSGDKNGLLR